MRSLGCMDRGGRRLLAAGSGRATSAKTVQVQPAWLAQLGSWCWGYNSMSSVGGGGVDQCGLRSGAC